VERYECGKSCSVHACMPATVVGLLPDCGGNSEPHWGSWWTAMFYSCVKDWWGRVERFEIWDEVRGRRHKREGEDLVL